MIKNQKKRAKKMRKNKNDEIERLRDLILDLQSDRGYQ